MVQIILFSLEKLVDLEELGLNSKKILNFAVFPDTLSHTGENLAGTFFLIR
jgi:hypothetical protein